MTPDRYYNFDVSWSDMSETVLQVWWDDVIHDLILPLSQEEYDRLYRLYCEHMWEYESETETLIERFMPETYARLCSLIEPHALEKWGQAGRLSNGAHYDIWSPKEICEDYQDSPEDLEFLKAKAEGQLPWLK